MKKQNKDRVLELIRENKPYKEVAEILKRESGDLIAGSTFYRLKESVFPSQKMDKALEQSGEKRVEKEKSQKSQQRRAKWNSKKQQDADNSNLAKLINKGLYHGTFPLCKNKALKESDVQDINLGGAVVSNILYFFPDVDLNHPLVTLGTRALMFYIRFKAICSAVKEKVDAIKDTIGGNRSGIKEGWEPAK